ncbi:MAG: response regulator [Candidatus Riflebacteria bacterium]|nr:response regulator [Candidatus Riflebacteria bacterium]
MKKVYIVDDDRDIIDAMTIVLKSAGYEVGSQTDDHDVAANAIRYGADLIILDVMFPENEGAGFEVARALRENEATRSVPILMLSAVNERRIYPGRFTNKDRDEAWLPVNEFVEKPINPKALLERVAALLGVCSCIHG